MQRVRRRCRRAQCRDSAGGSAPRAPVRPPPAVTPASALLQDGGRAPVRSPSSLSVPPAGHGQRQHQRSGAWSSMMRGLPVRGAARLCGTEYRLQWLSTSCIFHSNKDKGVTPTAGTAKEEAAEEGPVNTKENLLNLIGGMKVELSAKKKFQALKMHRMKEQGMEQHSDMESTSSMFQKATEDNRAKSKLLSPEIQAAASAVASSLPFDKNQTESELLQQLRKHEEETDAQKRGETNSISNIISEMKIGKRPLTRAVSRPANQIRFDDDGQGYTSNRGVAQELGGVRSSRRGLYAGKRLNVFAAKDTPTVVAAETESTPTLWDLELANQIASVSKRMPRNGFEEMIQWTKDGKLWEFPINNEAGLEEEQNVEFHKHVFLEKHLEDFPKQGPIRHFMELVICGLSKNPYLSVRQKTEHIQWYHDYFQEKEDILKESGVCLV